MKLFVSYAHEDRKVAEEITFALRAEGHRVFFDRDSLVHSEPYISAIRVQIEESNGMIFLISPYSVKEGSYCLAELEIAKSNKIQVLYVRVGTTDDKPLPLSIRYVQIMETNGPIPAAVEAAISKWPLYPRYLGWLGRVMVAGGTIFGTLNFIDVLTETWMFIGDRWILIPTTTFLCVLLGVIGAVKFWSGHEPAGEDKETSQSLKRRWCVVVFLALFALMSIATSILTYRYLYPPPLPPWPDPPL